MWQQYFGKGLQYHGIDINYLCAELFDGMPGAVVHRSSRLAHVRRDLVEDLD